MGSKGGGSTQTSTSTSSVPKNVNRNYNYVVDLAKQAASKPYEQYTGPRLAGFTPMQNQAFDSLTEAENLYEPYFNKAQGLIDNSTQDIWSQLPQFSEEEINKYMNPYTNQVIDATMANINKNNSLQQNQLRGNAIASGAWGGDRAGVAAAELARNQDLASNQAIAGLRSDAYNSALQQYNAARDAQLGALQSQAGLGMQAAGLYGNMGNSAQQNALQQALAQLQGGTLQQQLEQQGLDVQYNDWQQQQQYPFQTTQWLANILLGLNPGGGTTTSTQPTQSSGGNTLSTIAGLGLSAASLFSDERVKEDITRVGELDNGLAVYAYRYKGQPTMQIGLMAQDVEKKNPDAVGEVNGIKTVNYEDAAFANGGPVSWIPDNSAMISGMQRMGAPDPVMIEQKPDQDTGLQDMLSIVSAAKGLKGAMGGNSASEVFGDGWHNTQSQGDAAANAAGIKWNNDPSGITWNQPTRQHGPYRPARGISLYANGGVTPSGARVVEGYVPMTSGTPVYSFYAGTGNPVDNTALAPTVQQPKAAIPSFGNWAAEQIFSTPDYLSKLTGARPSATKWEGKSQDNYINSLMRSLGNRYNEAYPDGMDDDGYARGGIAGYANGGSLGLRMFDNVGDNPTIASLYDMYNPYNNSMDGGRSATPPAGIVPVNAPLPMGQTIAPKRMNAPPPLGLAVEGYPFNSGLFQDEQVSGGDSGGGLFDRIMNDPQRAALLRAGLATLAGKDENALANIAAGGMAALTGYGADRKEKRDADLEALKLKAALEKSQNKPLAASVLKLQNEAINNIGTAGSIKADLGQLIKDIDSGTLDLGLFKNIGSGIRNYVGASSPESRKYSSFRSTLEKIRNDSLRLNAGVQTEGDAVRAFNEILTNINDPKLVRDRLEEIQNINERGAKLKALELDQIRQNYGLPPIDTESIANPDTALLSGDDAPPAEGARKAPDGNWYIQDPNNPSKYLMVKK